MSHATKRTVHRAIKEHRCFWCGETIEGGTRYERWRWFDSGSALTIATHLECSRAWFDAAEDESDANYAAAFGEHHRGCRCQHDRCECGSTIQPVNAATDS